MSLAGPFPVEAAIEQLRSVTELRLIGGAGGLQTAMRTPPRAMPAAYVLLRERGRAGDYADTYAQPMEATLTVVLWVSHAGDETGEKAAAAMTRLEREVRTRLRDWTPAKPFEPLWVSDSGNDQFLGSHLTRQVIFRTQYRDQEMP